MLFGMIARPRATSSRTNSGVMTAGIAAPKLWPGMLTGHALRKRPRHLLALQVLADRDEFHLRRDDAAPRVVHLRDVGSGLRSPRLAMELEAQARQFRIGEPRAAVRRCGGRRAGPCRRARRSSARAAQEGRDGCRWSLADPCTGPTCRRRRSADSSPRPKEAGVSDCAISRIGTRRSAREPST